MARQAQTKRKLNETTTLVSHEVADQFKSAVVTQTPPAMGHNQPNLPDDKIVMQQVKQGFEDNTGSIKLKGSAVQRVAYAVMVHHERLGLDIDPWPALSTYVDSKESRETIAAHMRAHFLDAAVDTTAYDNQEVADARDPGRRNGQLLTRAMEFASTLALKGITFDAFNFKVGNFATPPLHLIPKNKDGKPMGSAQGRLARDLTILLDNRPLAILGEAANGNPRTMFFNASVTHYIAVNKPKTARANAQKPAKMVDIANITPEKLAGMSGISSALLINAWLAINAPDGDTRSPDALPSDYDEWNAMIGVKILVDEAIANQIKADAAETSKAAA